MKEEEKAKKEIVEKVAEKIWEITGKNNERTEQNWIDAEEIVDLVYNNLGKKETLKSNTKKAKEK
ncbi:MAG: hypothetical protein ACP5SC_08215 [Desulfurella sp.]